MSDQRVSLVAVVDGETWVRSATVVRRDSLRTSGGFDPRLSNFEDWDVLWRIAKAGRVVTIPEALVLHRTHPGNTNSSWVEAAEPWLVVMRKHLLECQPCRASAQDQKNVTRWFHDVTSRDAYKQSRFQHSAS
mgnify:CR=1 FL=1